MSKKTPANALKLQFRSEALAWPRGFRSAAARLLIGYMCSIGIQPKLLPFVLHLFLPVSDVDVQQHSLSMHTCLTRFLL